MSVTVTYSVRGGGLVPVTILASTTVPTAAQAAQVQKQAALIQFGADGDTQALFTHNWGLDASAPAYYEPSPAWQFVALPTTTVAVGLTFDWSNTNVLKVNKASATGSACTILVTIRRPHSIGQ